MQIKQNKNHTTLRIVKDKIIDSIQLDLNNDKNNQNIQNNLDTIQSFINEIPNFRKYEEKKLFISNAKSNK